jgi:hypothetical protein
VLLLLALMHTNKYAKAPRSCVPDTNILLALPKSCKLGHYLPAEATPGVSIYSRWIYSLVDLDRSFGLVGKTFDTLLSIYFLADGGFRLLLRHDSQL